MPTEHPFVKDLGYLAPFLQKLKAYALEMPDRKTGARLAALVDEEISRWKEIIRLVEAAPAKPAAGARAAAANAPANAAPPASRARAWTIGPMTRQS